MNAARFTWSGSDVGYSSRIVSALARIGQYRFAEDIAATCLELQGFLRDPDLADAWRFFNAAKKLRCYSDTALPAQAQAIGRRIALAVTELDVFEVQFGEAGGTRAFAVSHYGPRERRP